MLEITRHEAKLGFPRVIVAHLESEVAVVTGEGTSSVRLVTVDPMPKTREQGWDGPSGLRMSDDIDSPLGDHDDPVLPPMRSLHDIFVSAHCVGAQTLA